MNKEVARYIADLIIDKLEKDTPKNAMCLSNYECIDIEKALINENLKDLENYIIKKYNEWGDIE